MRPGSIPGKKVRLKKSGFDGPARYLPGFSCAAPLSVPQFYVVRDF